LRGTLKRRASRQLNRVIVDARVDVEGLARIGLSLYAKRLDGGKLIWPSASAGAVSISAAQMAYTLEGVF
jgi:hypothetical protein